MANPYQPSAPPMPGAAQGYAQQWQQPHSQVAQYGAPPQPSPYYGGAGVPPPGYPQQEPDRGPLPYGQQPAYPPLQQSYQPAPSYPPQPVYGQPAGQPVYAPAQPAYQQPPPQQYAPQQQQQYAPAQPQYGQPRYR